MKKIRWWRGGEGWVATIGGEGEWGGGRLCPGRDAEEEGVGSGGEFHGEIPDRHLHRHPGERLRGNRWAEGGGGWANVKRVFTTLGISRMRRKSF